MASAPPRSVAEATAARDKLMTTLAAQDGILGGLQDKYGKIAEIKRINDAIATYERALASRKIDAAQIQQSKTDIKFAAGLRLPEFKITVPFGKTTIQLKTLKDGFDYLSKLLREIGIDPFIKKVAKSSTDLATEIDPRFTVTEQELKAVQDKRAQLLEQIRRINNEILGKTDTPANNAKYRGRTTEDLNREVEEHLQIAETLVETYGGNISTSDQRKINMHLSEARNLLSVLHAKLTEAEAAAKATSTASSNINNSRLDPTVAASANATIAALNQRQAAQQAARNAGTSVEKARVAGEEARRVAANLQRTRNETAATNARIARLREQLEATQQKAQAIAALPVNTTGPLNNGSSNTTTSRTGRAAISSSTVQPSINTAALAAKHRQDRQAAAQGSSFSIENVNNNNNSGPILNSPTVPSGETGTGNVRNTPVYQSGTPEVRAQLNAIAEAAAAGLPPLPVTPNTRRKAALASAEAAANEASRRATTAREALQLLQKNPIDITPLTKLKDVQKALAEEQAELANLQASLRPIEQNVNTTQAKIEKGDQGLEASRQALSAAENAYRSTSGANIITRVTAQQKRDALLKNQDQALQIQQALVKELMELERTIASINGSIAEQTRQIGRLETKQAQLSGNAEKTTKQKEQNNAEIGEAAEAAAVAEASAAAAAAKLKELEDQEEAIKRQQLAQTQQAKRQQENTRTPEQIAANNAANEESLAQRRAQGIGNNENVNNSVSRVPVVSGQTNPLTSVKKLTRGQKKSLITHTNPLTNLSGTNFKPQLNVPSDINTPLRNQTRTKGTAKATTTTTTKSTATSTSPMTRRWRCMKPGTDLPCTTTGGRHRLRHRRTQKHKYSHSRKLHARTKRTKRQRR